VSCRIGTTGAAIEICRNARPAQCVFEETDVLLRRANDDCDFVKPDATLCFFQDASRDLDTFAALAGRGKPFQLTRPLPLRRSFRGENITLELSQIAALIIVGELGAHTPFFKFPHGRNVAGRNRDHHSRGSLN